MKYWLMKSEPLTYGIDHLKKDGTTEWSGVRNYQARNFMMHDMSVGDLVLFYHSYGNPNGIYGVAKVVKAAHADPTQFDPQGEYFDAKAAPEKPRWFCVDVGFVKKFDTPVPLEEIKADTKLSGMVVAQVGSRLSIQPVLEEHFKHIYDQR